MIGNWNVRVPVFNAVFNYAKSADTDTASGIASVVGSKS